MKTCTLFLPSRGRFNLLLESVSSLINTADMPWDFDIHVKFDDDDYESILRVEELLELRHVRVLIAPRLNGYPSLETFYDLMAEWSDAAWVCCWNDDAIMRGRSWDTLLRSVPTTGFIVQPEIYQLNQSKYFRSEGGAFPFFPRLCWKQFGWERLIQPTDTRIDQLLRIQNGWKTQFLEGVTVFHDRTGTVPA